MAGPNKQWTFWVCEPSEFPIVYPCVEHAYVLTGTYFVTYEGTTMANNIRRTLAHQIVHSSREDAV